MSLRLVLFGLESQLDPLRPQHLNSSEEKPLIRRGLEVPNPNKLTNHITDWYWD
jgi:hypothetical protein